MTTFGKGLVEAARQAQAFARGEVDPSTCVVRVPADIDVKAIRKGTGLTQAEFAQRFGFPIGTLRDLEQGPAGGRDAGLPPRHQPGARGREAGAGGGVMPSRLRGKQGGKRDARNQRAGVWIFAQRPLRCGEECVNLHKQQEEHNEVPNSKGPTMAKTPHDRRAREVISALFADGWDIFRRGPGDHIQFKHPVKPGKVTIDNGEPEIPIGTLRSIYRQAGWDW